MSYGNNTETGEYQKLLQQFKRLTELHDNQKKIIAKLQERNLELEQELDHLKGKPLSTISYPEEDDNDVDQSEFYYRED